MNTLAGKAVQRPGDMQFTGSVTGGYRAETSPGLASSAGFRAWRDRRADLYNFGGSRSA
jgi:hypothetical protein